MLKTEDRQKYYEKSYHKPRDGCEKKKKRLCLICSKIHIYVPKMRPKGQKINWSFKKKTWSVPRRKHWDDREDIVAKEMPSIQDYSKSKGLSKYYMHSVDRLARATGEINPSPVFF